MRNNMHLVASILTGLGFCIKDHTHYGRTIIFICVFGLSFPFALSDEILYQVGGLFLSPIGTVFLIFVWRFGMMLLV